MKRSIAIIGAKGLPAQDGISRVVEGYLPYLIDKYDFTVLCTQSHTNRKTGFYEGYKEIVFPSIKNKRLNTLWYYIKSCTHILFGKKYDLIHFHHCDAAFLFPFIRMRYGKKFIVTTHGAFTPLNDKWKKFALYFYLQYRIFLRCAPHLTGVSKNEVERTRKYLNKTSTFIPNGININEKTLDVNVGNNYIFFAAGRIMGLKGLDILLEAVRKIGYKHQIIVAGDMSMAPESFKQKIQNLSHDLNIKFLGLIKEKPLLLKYLKSCSLFVFPSLAETMSMQLLEAASMHAPIIASDIPENKDVFSSEEVLYFKSGDSGDLANKILYALNNPSDMKERADRAYNSLIKGYSWKTIASDYQNEYDKLINDNA